MTPTPHIPGAELADARLREIVDRLQEAGPVPERWRDAFRFTIGARRWDETSGRFVYDEAVAETGVLFASMDWQLIMDAAEKLRTAANAYHQSIMATVEALEDQSRELAQQSGDMGHLS